MLPSSPNKEITAATANEAAIRHHLVRRTVRRVDPFNYKGSAQASERSQLELRRDLARARITYDLAQTAAGAAEARVQDLEAQVERFGAIATPVDFEQFRLSHREIDVLRILVQTRGRNRDIGESLGITERAVKSHIYRICNKIGVDTRLELAEFFRWNWSLEEQTDEGK